jgi:hypothetical protein
MTLQLFKSLLIILLIISSFNCSKESLEETNNNRDTALCVIEIKRSAEHLVSKEQLNYVEYLFEKNNLSLDNQQIRKITSRESAQGDVLCSVSCQQFYGSLPIEYRITAYHFKNELLWSITRPILDETIFESIDTIPSFSKDMLAFAFVDTIRKDTMVYKSGLDIDSLIEDCVIAELIIHFSITETTLQDTFQLAYMFTIDENLPEPEGYYNAHNGELIYYWNGWIIGK